MHISEFVSRYVKTFLGSKLGTHSCMKNFPIVHAKLHKKCIKSWHAIVIVQIGDDMTLQVENLKKIESQKKEINK